MELETARTLIALNTAFYRKNAQGFAATRSNPWPGWKRVVSLLKDSLEPGRAASILDLACGTMRFERFLAQALPDRRLSFYAVDNCAALATGDELPAHTTFYDADILGTLAGRLPNAREAASPSALDALPSCDLSCCFGFMHHVPGSELRTSVMRLLVEHTRPGGLIALSFWQFMNDEKLARKASQAEQAIREHPESLKLAVNALEEGDHLLGWQESGSFRYCHHFTEDEIDRLVAMLPTGAVRELSRYSNDGKSRKLNRYVVLQRL